MEKAALRKRLLELELEKAEREQKAQKAQKTKQPSAILAPACRFFRSGGCANGKDCRFSHVLPSVTHTSATPLCSEVLLSDFVRLYENWPQGHGADRISAAEAATSGTVRHDLLVEADHVGRIIGKEGKTMRGICESTGCEVFVFDKDGAPPDTVAHLRLVSLVGLPMAVCNANKAVSDAISDAIRRDAIRPHHGAGQPRPDQREDFPYACASCGFTRRRSAFTLYEQGLGAAARCRQCTDPASLCTCAGCSAARPYYLFGTSQFAMEGGPKPKSKEALKPGALCKVCAAAAHEMRLHSLCGAATQPCALCGEQKEAKAFSKEQRGHGVAAVCDACERRNPSSNSYGRTGGYALGDGCPIEYVCPTCGCGEARRAPMLKHLRMCSPKLIPKKPKGLPFHPWAHLKVVGWHLTRSAAVRALSDVAPPRVHTRALSTPCDPCRSAGHRLHPARLRMGRQIGRGRCEGLARAPPAP